MSRKYENPQHPSRQGETTTSLINSNDNKLCLNISTMKLSVRYNACVSLNLADCIYSDCNSFIAIDVDFTVCCNQIFILVATTIASMSV